jgi:hypothetical protein
MGSFCEECPDRIKPNRVGKKGRICADCAICTGRPNPPARTEEQTHNRKGRPRCLALRPNPIACPLPTTLEENAAYIAGKAAFDAKFRGISEVYPERKVTISVAVHSEASSVSFKQECCNGSLVGKKKRVGIGNSRLSVLISNMELPAGGDF